MSEPAIEVRELSKRYRPHQATGLVPIPWLTRRRRRRAQRDRQSPLDVGDTFSTDFDDEEDDDEEVMDHGGAPDRDVWALRDVNFTLDHGRVLGVIGGNGAGKSTLIRVLSGVTAPTSGHAITRGRVAPDLRVAGAFLDAHRSGVQCIFQLARFVRIPRSVAKGAIEPIRELTELGDALELPTRTYSTGQLQRLAYAMTLCLDPDILLVEGALTVGDHEFRVRASEALSHRVAGGLTAVVATHDARLLQEFCTDALWLTDGTVAAFGDPADVAAAYGEDFAATVARRSAQAPRDGIRGGSPSEGVITSAGIYDMKGRATEFVRTSQDALAELTFQLREVPKRVRCVVSLRRDGGARVRIAQPDVHEASETGTYIASVHVPRGTLPPGSYQAHLAVLEYVEGTAETLGRRTISLDVVGGSDTAGSDISAERLRLPWEVARVGPLQ